MSLKYSDPLGLALGVPESSGLRAWVHLITAAFQLLTKAKEACIVVSLSQDGLPEPIIFTNSLPRLKITTPDRLPKFSNINELIWLQDDDALLKEIGMTTGPFLYASLHFRNGLCGGIVLAEPSPDMESHQLTALRENASIAVENILLLQDLQNKNQYLSDYDDLVTKLPNRRVFHNLIVNAIRPSPPHQLCTLFFIDIDDLKHVNRKLGYKTGDRLLFLIAQRMLDFVRHRRIDSIPARVGGDEFGLLITATNKIESIEALASDMIADIRRPLNVDETDFMITASMGISKYPSDAVTADDLVFCAEQAMFSAKDRGKNTFMFFNQSH